MWRLRLIELVRLGILSLYPPLVVSEASLSCPAGLVANILLSDKCELCPRGTYKSESDTKCVLCSAGYRCGDWVASLLSGDKPRLKYEYDSGGKNGRYGRNEKVYKQVSCPAGSFIVARVTMLNTERDHDYLLLSSFPFDKTITPSPSMDTSKYLYVGSGSTLGYYGDSYLLKEVPVPASDMFLLFYSDGSVVGEGYELIYSCYSSGAVDQIPCGVGKYSQAGSLQCTECEAGHYCPSSTEPLPLECPAREYSGSTGATSCLPCPSGTYANEGASMCFDCQGGVPPLEGFIVGHNCSFIVPKNSSVSIQTAAFHTIVDNVKGFVSENELNFDLGKSPDDPIFWKDQMHMQFIFDADRLMTNITYTDETEIYTVNSNLLSNVFQYLHFFVSLQEIKLDWKINEMQLLRNEWSTLTRLETLDLSAGCITGSLPREYATMSKLTYVDLSKGMRRDMLPVECHLVGTLPSEWSSMSRVRVLNLAHNQLEGPLPKEWSSMASLQILSFTDNKLSGPFPPELSFIQSVTVEGNQLVLDPKSIYCKNNSWDPQCRGRRLSVARGSEGGRALLGDEGVLINMVKSNPAVNWHVSWKATEPVCEWIGVLATCEGSITIYRIELTGTGLRADLSVFNSLGSLTKLERLDLSNNRITGSLAAEWKSWSSLKELNLRGNQITGSLPSEWNSWSAPYYVNLSDNRIQGGLPKLWGSWSSLQELFLEGNLISGGVPQEWGELSNCSLNKLVLSGNRISALPSRWKCKISTLNLDDNEITGSLSPLWTNVNELRLSRNQITGSLPSEWGTGFKGLNHLFLSGNKLEGVLPKSFSSMKIQSLHLDSNRISGPIPTEWSSMTELSRLNLSHNLLNGTIPTLPPKFYSADTYTAATMMLSLEGNFLKVTREQTVSKLFMRFSHVAEQYIEEEYNSLTSFIALLEGGDLGSLKPSKTKRSLTLPGVKYHLVEAGGYVALGAVSLSSRRKCSIDMSSTSSSLSSLLSSLEHLADLDLSNSNLTGAIDKFIFPPNLRTLDLSKNAITGLLPRQFLPSSLTTLDLSDNQLTDCFSLSSECGCFDGRCFPPSLQVLDMSNNNLGGTFTFNTNSVCLHSNLTVANFSGTYFESLDVSLLDECDEQNLFLSVRYQKQQGAMSCPFTWFPPNVILSVDGCVPNTTGLWVMLGSLGAGALWLFLLWVTGAKTRFGIRDRLKLWLKKPSTKLIKYLVSVVLNITDIVLDSVAYNQMIDEIKTTRKSNTQRMCEAWNSNLDLSLEGIQKDHGNNTDMWKYIDTLAFFKDKELLKITTTINDKVVPLIKTPQYFFSVMNGLKVFERNKDGSNVIDTLVNKHRSTCIENGVKNNYQFCYMDNRTYECKAKEPNLYDDFLLVVWASIAIVVFKELVKVVVIAYLMCCKRGGEGVPRGLRTVVLSSVFSPLLPLVLPLKVFQAQLVMHENMYQDEIRSLFYDVILENMNQLALGVVFITYITQNGIEWYQLALYPLTALKLLLTFVSIIKGMTAKPAAKLVRQASKAGRSLSRAYSRRVVGGSDTITRGGRVEMTEVETKVNALALIPTLKGGEGVKVDSAGGGGSPLIGAGADADDSVVGSKEPHEGGGESNDQETGKVIVKTKRF